MDGKVLCDEQNMNHNIKNKSSYKA